MAKIKAAEIVREWALKLETVRQLEGGEKKWLVNAFRRLDEDLDVLLDPSNDDSRHMPIAVLRKERARTGDSLENWLATLVNDAPKTRHMKKSTIEGFALLLPKLGDITRPKVQEWIDRQISGGKSVATIRCRFHSIPATYSDSIPATNSDRIPATHSDLMSARDSTPFRPPL